MDLIALVEAHGRRQHGLVARTQLQELGASRDQVFRLRSRGVLQDTPWRGVYRCVGAPETRHQHLMAACLVNGRATVVSHRSALAFHGLHLPGVEEIIEVTAPRPASARTDGVIVHRAWRLDPFFVHERDGFLVTRIDRTLIDCGAVLAPAELAEVIEQSFVRKRTTPSRLMHWACTLDAPRRLGPPAVRAYLETRAMQTTLPDSILEVRAADLCREAGIPEPVFQFEVTIGDRTYRIDMSWPEIMFAVEVEGWEFHTDLWQWEYDRIRRSDLELLGWRVIQVTYRQVVDHPRETAATIRRHVERRQTEWAALAAMHSLGA